MMLGHQMDNERIPCVYEISFKKGKKGNPPCIELRLHEEFVEANKDLVPLDFFIKNLQNTHNLGEFFSLAGDRYGFDGVIKKKGKDSRGFVLYEIDIPVFRKESTEICERCEGTGWDEDLNSKCLSCRGRKHKVIFDWKPLFAISASLHMLGIMLEIFDKKTSAKNHQLITFQLSCGEGMGRFPVWGHYGIDFCAWLNSFGSSCHQFNQVIKEMEAVYLHIYSEEPFGCYFQAYVEGGSWLILSCPGDACGLHPLDYGWKLGKGREFSCHNMDNPGQQILLLVALAILSDMARKYMKG